MTHNPPRSGVAAQARYVFPAALVWWTRALALAERTLAPLADLAVRLALAQAFFASGVLKLADWNTAVYLAANEYPVAWLSPVAAAALGVTTEVAGSVLFALGLATRPAAIALAALTVVVQTSYVALDSHLLWIAVFGWYAVRGAGSISLDAAFARGLAQSALPLGAPVARAFDWANRRLEPVHELALRLWLAGALALAALAAAAPALPWQSAGIFPAGFALACAALLAAGIAMRLAGLALLAASLAFVPSAAHEAALMAWALLGLLFAVRGAGPLSLDGVLRRRLARKYPELAGGLGYDLDAAPRVVIVGAGFGGLACAAALRHTPVKVTLVDRRNYHLFQPLLYQVATASLAPGRHRDPDPRALPRPAERAGRARRGERRRPDAAGSARRRAAAALRLPRAGERRAPRLLRPRRVGALRARPQAGRGRDRDPPAPPDRVRAGRERRRSSRARARCSRSRSSAADRPASSSPARSPRSPVSAWRRSSATSTRRRRASC